MEEQQNAFGVLLYLAVDRYEESNNNNQNSNNNANIGKRNTINENRYHGLRTGISMETTK